MKGFCILLPFITKYWSLEFQIIRAGCAIATATHKIDQRKMHGGIKKLLTSLHIGGSRAFSAEKRKTINT